MGDEGAPSGSHREYVVDVAYLRNFVDDLAPARLSLVAALNGFSPPPSRSFDYCELGCGNGDTTATLAAAHPDSRFVGVDFNPEHITFANGLATRGELGNVRFLERDFADLAREDLPDFDFITAHGVLSWIGPDTLRALLDFVAKKLKPGGLFYVSYNALPGWAAIEPLRRFMLDAASGVEGNSLERARHGVRAARALADAGAAYFTQNPAVRSVLDAMSEMGLAYVVHEYMHDHWSPRYFADVAREMASRSLHFIGELPLHLNYRDLALPPSLAPIFKGIQNRITFESLKDYSVNESFRRDVYVRGEPPCSDAATRAYLDATAFGTISGEIKRDTRLPHYTLQFAGTIFDALIPALAEGNATIAELACRSSLAAFGADKIRDALVRLALGNQITPMRGATLRGDAPKDARYRAGLPYNRMILEQRLSSKSPVVLASPIAGTGIAIPTIHAASLRLLTEIAPESRAAWIRSFVERQTITLHDGGKVIEEKEEQAAVVSREHDRFCAIRLPQLIKLGVLEKVS